MVAGDGGIETLHPEPNKTMGWGSPVKQQCSGGLQSLRALEGGGGYDYSDSPENA